RTTTTPGCAWSSNQRPSASLTKRSCAWTACRAAPPRSLTACCGEAPCDTSWPSAATTPCSPTSSVAASTNSTLSSPPRTGPRACAASNPPTSSRLPNAAGTCARPTGEDEASTDPCAGARASLQASADAGPSADADARPDRQTEEIPDDEQCDPHGEHGERERDREGHECADAGVLPVPLHHPQRQDEVSAHRGDRVRARIGDAEDQLSGLRRDVDVHEHRHEHRGEDRPHRRTRGHDQVEPRDEDDDRE